MINPNPNVLQLQVMCYVLIAVYLGYALGSQWSSYSREPKSIRIFYSVLLVSIPLLSVLPTVFPFLLWLAIVIGSMGAGIVLCALHQLVGQKIWSYDEHQASGRLVAARAVLMLGAMSFLHWILDIRIDWHLLKIAPMVLVAGFSMASNGVMRRKYGAGRDWYIGHAINVGVYFVMIVLVIFVI